MKIPTDFIESNFSAADFLANCDEVFRLYGQGLATMPPREQNVDALGRFTLKMPASIPGYTGYKFIEELPSESQGKLGQRSAVIKIQPENNEVASNAIEMDAEYITNMRTGAAGALGLKYFAPQVKSVAILGTGKISKAVALCLAELGVTTINVHSRNAENREKFKQEIIKHSVFDNIILHDSIASALVDTQAILSAVPTPEPILFFKDLPAGVFISVMGGDSRTTQLDKEIMIRAIVIPDNEEQCKKSGEFKQALTEGYYQDINFARIDNRVANIGDASLGRLELGDGVKVAYFTGLAVQDVNAAKMVYEKFIKTA
ncbi:MAG: NAD(P)-binding domain-containing protein [bacterium]|nr:NAD(P)-binding domain-containing protein [bacterium]